MRDSGSRNAADGRDLTLVRMAPQHELELSRFFQRLAEDQPAAALFHPHPFTSDEAAKIANYQGRDYYAGALTGGGMVAYGMLRGWDEGYDVPSLGIAVDARFRGAGLGRLMMEYLHQIARLRGAPSIMLKVYKDNRGAADLYRKLGYVLTELNEREWRGTLLLRPSS